MWWNDGALIYLFSEYSHYPKVHQVWPFINSKIWFLYVHKLILLWQHSVFHNSQDIRNKCPRFATLLNFCDFAFEFSYFTLKFSFIMMSYLPHTPAVPCQCPQTHLNQQTRCHTKDSGFYYYFFICYRHSHNNRKETTVSGRKKSQRQFTFVNFITFSRSLSFPTISFPSVLLLVFLFLTYV